jgi:bacteriocin biosynthesis cyclodehydratase domain-containing protein
MTDVLDEATTPAVVAAADAELPASQTRLVRNPYVTVIRCTDDEVLVRHGSRSRYSRVLRDDDRRRLLGPLLGSFEQPRSRKDAASAFADLAPEDQVGELVDQLTADGILIAESSGTFEIYRSVVGGRPLRALDRTSVGIVGLGATGRQLAAQLAELGVGRLVGLATGAGGASGRHSWPPGVEQLAGSLDDVPDEDVLLTLLDDTDVVVLTLDGFRPALLHRLNRAAVAAGRSWLPVYADGSEVIIGPLVVPGESACYNEHEIQHEASRALRREYQLYSEELGRAPGDGPPLLAPYAAIAASWAAIGLTALLTDGTSFLVGRAVRVDFERLEVTSEHVLRLPRCPVCTPHRPSFRHPFL